MSNPATFYDWFRPLLGKFMAAQPNPAHRVLAEMENCGRLSAVITQNIDSLHQAAGSRRVLELHGHTRTATCLSCGDQTPATDFVVRDSGRRCAAPLRRNAVGCSSPT